MSYMGSDADHKFVACNSGVLLLYVEDSTSLAKESDERAGMRSFGSLDVGSTLGSSHPKPNLQEQHKSQGACRRKL